MSVKVFALGRLLAADGGVLRQLLSDAVHASMVQALGLPEEKRAHRFVRLEDGDVFVPGGRSESYVTIEVMLMTGRTAATKAALIKGIFENVQTSAKIAPVDVEIIIMESPPENWGFRGLTGAEALAQLNYKVDV